jgi:hypothetical protein
LRDGETAQRLVEVLVHEIPDQRLLGADQLVQELHGKDPQLLRIVIQHDLRENLRGDVLARLGAGNVDLGPAADHLEDLFQHHVAAPRGVVIAPIRILPQIDAAARRIDSCHGLPAFAKTAAFAGPRSCLELLYSDVSKVKECG